MSVASPVSSPPADEPVVPISRSSTLSSTYDEGGQEPDLGDSPSISQIYCDAALYEKILAGDGCMLERSPGATGGNGFADLVSRDLDPSGQAIADRFAKLSVASDTLVPSNTATDPQTYQEAATRDPTENVMTATLDGSAEDLILHPPPHRVSEATEEEQNWKMAPEQVVDLLVQEFGTLALEGDEEKLILETDGGLMKDVLIIGVIHLTTHRLTFHATLLAARPDLLPSQQILKSGPCILHRKGFHTKRRVWVELSHDMLCSYSSSREEDRIQPLRSVLLSSVKEILPIDPQHPKYLYLIFDSDKEDHGVAEFDTEESALDWRRELTGAIFMYRHSRREQLNPDNETENGIRCSIPLQQIGHVKFSDVYPFVNVATLAIEAGARDPEYCSTVQLGPVLNEPQWAQMTEHIETAKKRGTHHDSHIFVDFGPLTFSQSDMPQNTKTPEDAGNKYRAVRNSLALGAEKQLWIVRASIYRSIASSGYFVVSDHYVGFWSKSFTQDDIRYRFPITTVKKAKPFHSKLGTLQGLALELEGLKDLRFVFKNSDVRDEAVQRVVDALENNSPTSTISDTFSFTTTSTLSSDLPSISKRDPHRSMSATSTFAPLSRSIAAAQAKQIPAAVQLTLPKTINLPQQLLSHTESLHFMCLTIGSRGDVQPYIALGLGLLKEGHRVTIVTHEEYRDWILGFGIEHRTAGGDPGALMKLSVENKMFSPEFFKESLQNFRPWLDALLVDSWEACQDADVLLESPSAMAGVHIAEALNIPYFRTFTMPWTKTSAFPHAFLAPPVEAPSFNSSSYVLFENVMWTATSGQINRWRKHTLKIGSTDMGHLAQSKITFIYNFSSAVVPKPLDWGDTIIISGYWFLDNPDLNWTPPADLIEWMAKARKDGKPIVYIGFGSITVPHPNRVTARIVKAVLKSNVRAIISKGWSARMSKASDNDVEVEIPPECYSLDKVPHDWLFPQIDAALHHGGAGTTGASLRAGIPTLIKPWFGDQYFWASRVQKLGAGLRVPSLHVSDLSEALTKATTSRIMKEKAALIGEKIRSEDGVHAAIHAIYTYLPRAGQNRKSLK